MVGEVTLSPTRLDGGGSNARSGEEPVEGFWRCVAKALGHLVGIEHVWLRVLSLHHYRIIGCRNIESERNQANAVQTTECF
jgi:hypothetical protein